MKFEVILGDGSCKVFNSADEVDSYKQCHGDEYGGIERISARSDSGRESTSWESGNNDWIYAREAESRFTKCDRDYEKEQALLDAPSSCDSSTSEPERGTYDSGNTYGALVSAFLTFSIISYFTPFLVGRVAYYLAGIVLVVIMLCALWDFLEWLVDRL